MWDIYNTIREVESSFRILKTDLSLRPVYHIHDNSCKAHLFLGVLAYTIVSTKHLLLDINLNSMVSNTIGKTLSE